MDNNEIDCVMKKGAKIRLVKEKQQINQQYMLFWQKYHISEERFNLKEPRRLQELEADSGHALLNWALEMPKKWGAVTEVNPAMVGARSAHDVGLT